MTPKTGQQNVQVLSKVSVKLRKGSMSEIMQDGELNGFHLNIKLTGSPKSCKLGDPQVSYSILCF